MRFTERVAIRLKNTGALISTLRIVYNWYWLITHLRIRALIDSLLLLPEFYRVHAGAYKAQHLVNELKKVYFWHSNWLGLIDFFELDTEFNRLFDRASITPGIRKMRCFMLYQCLKQTGSLEGDVAEVGVYKGRSAKVIALTVERLNKQAHLFDTFTGMPEVDSEKDNLYRKGDFGDTSLAQVEKFLSDCQNVTIYPGFFPDTTEPVRDRKFCFAHVDVDIYRSVLDCCQFFYPRLASGGMMVFDDPGFADCAGAKIAVDEFFSDKEEFPIHLATSQVLVVKH
ncbi:TylF/MycF/NovP-related O-methyltransferase [Chloroflexota bacterium]